MGEVGGQLEGVNLNLSIWVEDSKPWGGDLALTGDASSFNGYHWNFSGTSEAIVRKGGCLAYYLNGADGTQSLFFVGLCACFIIKD